MSANGEKRPLPPGWRWAKLEEVCQQAETRDPRERPEDAFIYVDISSVDNVAKEIVGTQTVIGRDAPSRARKVIHTGDVLVATTRPNLNAVCLVPPELDDQICSTGFCVLRAGSGVMPDYLFDFVQSRYFIESVAGLVTGALYPAVTDSRVLAMNIPVSPLAEQRRIAARLLEQMAQVERMRPAAEAQAEAATALPSAFLRQVFESAEAKKWPRRKLGELCDVKGGKRLPAGTSFASTPTAYPYVRVVDFDAGGVRTEELKYIDELTHQQLARYIISREDVYISIAGSIGTAGVIPDQLDGAHLTENAARLVTRDKAVLDRDFLARFLQSPLGQVATKARTNMVGQPKLALERIATIEIPLPPLPYQRRATARLSEQMTCAERVRELAEAQLEAVNALPSALLEEVFGGFEPPP
jgi:type I restriction enzyme, S subunit